MKLLLVVILLSSIHAAKGGKHLDLIANDHNGLIKLVGKTVLLKLKKVDVCWRSEDCI